MKKQFDRIIQIGVHDDMPFYVQNKLRVYNAAAFLIAAINLVYGFVGLASGWYLASAFSGISIVLLLFGTYLNYIGKQNAAYHVSMIYSLSFISAFAIFFGKETQSHSFFYFLPVAIAIVFDNSRLRFIYLVIALLCFVFVRWSYGVLPPYYPVPTSELKFFGYSNGVFSLILIFMGVNLFKKENIQYAAEIERARVSIEEKNKEITDSIIYASRIQNAILPSREQFTSAFKDSFLWLNPRDIVSGDFYWLTEKDRHIYFAIADCTGHGVPGGFMTMLGVSFLDEVVNEKNEEDPAKILNLLREKIVGSLKQSGEAGENKDGMDIVLCRYDKSAGVLNFAGANNALYHLSEGKLNEYKGNKQPCGFFHQFNSFTTHLLTIKPGDAVYLFTDGFPDQFGGEKGKKYKYRQLEEKLILNSGKTMAQQQEMLQREFSFWKGGLEQVDDVLFCGIRF